MSSKVMSAVLKPLEYVPVKLIAEVAFQCGITAIAIGVGAALIFAFVIS